MCTCIGFIKYRTLFITESLNVLYNFKARGQGLNPGAVYYVFLVIYTLSVRQEADNQAQQTDNNNKQKQQGRKDKKSKKKEILVVWIENQGKYVYQRL